MKKLLYIMTMSLLLAACQDNRLDGLEPDRIYLPKSGVQTEEAYTIGETAVAQLWTYKSSYNGTGCRVTYTIDPDLLTAYNAANGTAYELLPESCYEIPQSTVEISGKDEYGRFTVNYSPEKIVELSGGVYDQEKYALPFRISSDEVETTDKNTSILVFRIKEPVVKMLSKSVAEIKFNYGASETMRQTVKFGMDFGSKWDCAFALETDDAVLAQALADYNAANKTIYTLLPADAYELSMTEGTIKVDMETVSVDVTVDPAKCKSGLYAVPVMLAGVEQPLRLSETDNICIVPVNCVGNYVDKTGWTVQVSSVNPNWGKPEYLIDGDINTYWHPAGRDFGAGRDDAPWAVADMKKTVRVTCFEIDPRQDQIYPQIFSNLRCYVSRDGVDFTEVGYVAIPWTAVVKCTVPVMPTEGRYVKFSIDYPKGQTSIAFAELSIRGEVVE